MKSWNKKAAVIAGGTAAGVIAAGGIQTCLWKRETRRAVARLLAGLPDLSERSFLPEEGDDLPAPVARYFAYALTPDQPPAPWARIRQVGEIRSGGFGSPWHAFAAEEHFTAQPSGFVWDACIQVGPFMPVRVRDSYTAGRGAGRILIGSLINIGLSGCPEINAGALHRYLAEAVWLPSALLPSQNLQWQPIDENRALATIRDGATEVSLEFEFGPQGEIVRAFTPERFREVQGRFLPTPWTCLYGDYASIRGMRVPLRGETEWHLPEGRLPCFRGRILSIEYGALSGARPFSFLRCLAQSAI